jgi:hypothetical protein
MRILICALALALGACAHQPYVQAPQIPKLNIAPVKRGNDEIAKGNKAIAEENKGVKAQLEDAKTKLAAAMLDATQDLIDKAKLSKNLADASEYLGRALEGNEHMFDTIGEQDARIAAQTQAINELQEENESRQKIIDIQTKNLNESRQEAADSKRIVDEVNKYWGLGAFMYGAKRLGWRLLIVVIVVAAISVLLQVFVPWARPFLTLIASAVTFPFRWLLKKWRPPS